MSPNCSKCSVSHAHRPFVILTPSISLRTGPVEESDFFKKLRSFDSAARSAQDDKIGICNAATGIS